MVTGTLGLAAPETRKAMLRAAELVKSGGGKLLVDVNWRPVFWDDLGVAKREILSFLDKADIVKISDADLEFLYDMQFVTALLNPCAVGVRGGWGALKETCVAGCKCVVASWREWHVCVWQVSDLSETHYFLSSVCLTFVSLTLLITPLPPLQTTHTTTSRWLRSSRRLLQCW